MDDRLKLLASFAEEMKGILKEMAAVRSVLLEGWVLRSILSSVPVGGRTCSPSRTWQQLWTERFAGPAPPSFVFLAKKAKLESLRGMATASERPPAATSQADIITKVKHDHDELEEYFGKYKAAHKKGDDEEAGKWFNQFVWEVSRHSVSEELVLYPLMSVQGDRGKDLAEQSRQDHQRTKDILEELMKTSDPDVFDKKMDQMMADLREHIKKEESNDLAYLRETVSDSARETAGTSFELGKKIAPTRPHAGVPNKPAALEAALGLLVTPVDKLRDLFTSFPSKS